MLESKASLDRETTSNSEGRNFTIWALKNEENINYIIEQYRFALSNTDLIQKISEEFKVAIPHAKKAVERYRSYRHKMLAQSQQKSLPKMVRLSQYNKNYQNIVSSQECHTQ